ncbi:asparagine synthase (glutamine-hydrolyzing) [Bacillus cereus group sp. BfR-BA-01331]|uniref:asparagine synthase (glutamine-hydrolyzing) n=1 Tax=Bacillus cereus group sp. BfR-BA-01331 TaxID=2920307 RepID=UPI0024139556|nr:asparagine synthase (glutamine-hydrolyzing) [Bacillus cereus group sp. BfR-BA-01331]
MCRIFGFFGNEKVDSITMSKVSDLQIKGGPDSQSFIIKENWAIGNNRLSIVDLAGGKQPYSLGEDIQVVFNGEIYNHDELREMLQERGYQFEDRCDGSIIPALYNEYGPDFARYLDGMFAIAVIDTKNATRLTLVTDPTGIKSLYYYWNPESKTLFFSSELPSLLGFNAVPRNLWLAGVDSYLTTKAIFGEHTMFKDVYVMPSSSILQLELNESPKLSRYETHLRSNNPTSDLSTASNLLEEQLSSEVSALLNADVPVSTINSGGLDSSFVTSLASQCKSDIHSFNISYTGEWPFDEKVYARDVANHCKTHHHEVKIDPKHFQDLLPDVVKHLGQPNADPITLSSYSLFEAVNQAGFKVAISGDGADEMFGGYERYVEAMNRAGDWIKPYVESLSAIEEELRWELYSDDYKTYLLDNGKTSEIIEDKLRQDGGNRLDTILDFERNYRLPSYHLRRVDHLSMAHSVEVRVPFCQPRIVKFAQQLTNELRIKDEKVKRVLYKSAEGKLPDSVLNRKKQPFTLPIDAMMRQGLPLFDFVKNTLNSNTIRKQNIFKPEMVEKLLSIQATKPNGKTALALWSLMIFQLWMEQFNVSISPEDTLVKEVVEVC